jgi:hypothetical protein
VGLGRMACEGTRRRLIGGYMSVEGACMSVLSVWPPAPGSVDAVCRMRWGGEGKGPRGRGQGAGGRGAGGGGGRMGC